MSNELDQYTAPAELLQTGPSADSAIGQLMQHADAMDAAYKLADAMCGTSLVPQIYRGKPNDGTAAILYGAELGLSPIQSLQQVFVVHGTPAIYARTMVALLKARGFQIWTVDSTDEEVTVQGKSPAGMTEMSTWTIERAEKAGYVPTIDEKTGKFATNANGRLIGNEKYLEDPQAMLYAKAAADVCRKLAPEALLGISRTREELELEEPPVRAKAERVDGPKRGTAGLAEKLGVGSARPAEEATGSKSELASTADLKRLHTVMTKHGITDKAEGLAFLASRIGVESISSSKELTARQVADTIAFLETGEESAGE